MGKIFVVTRGMYDMSIEGIYSTEELANAFAVTLDTSGSIHINEWDLDLHVEELLSGRIPFTVRGYDDPDGSYLKHNVESFDPDYREGLSVELTKTYTDTYLSYTVGVYASSADSAADSAKAMIMQWKAENPHGL